MNDSEQDKLAQRYIHGVGLAICVLIAVIVFLRVL